MNKNNLQENSTSSLHRPSGQEIRLRFLCPHHRDWVYFNSQQALEELDQIQLKGEILLEHQKWSKALPQLGSAWEITDILLQLYSGEKTFLVNRLCCLTVLLCSCMERMGHKDSVNQVYQQTYQILKTLAQQLEPDNEHRLYLNLCMEQMQPKLTTSEDIQVYFQPRSHGGASAHLH